MGKHKLIVLENMKSNYLYMHIVSNDGGGEFVSRLVDAFSSPDYHTSLSNHFWVTNNAGFYDKFKNKLNCVFESKDIVYLINKYGKLSKWIFVHGFNVFIVRMCFIRPGIEKRIIWRTWGHDVFDSKKKRSFFKRMASYIVFFVIKNKVKKFKFVGVANIVDTIKIHRVFGTHIKTIEFPYVKDKESFQHSLLVFDEIKNKYKKNDNIFRIMVGHSAMATDNHIAVIDKLRKFSNENILVYIMLPYGNASYAAKVSKHAQNVFGNKCVIIDKKVSYDEYFSFIMTMDIAIFDMENSAALGNISLLVKAQKKLFLKKGSDLHTAFVTCDIPCETTDSIDDMSFSDFSKPLQYDSTYACSKLSPSMLDVNYSCNIWNYIFEEVLL